MSASANLLSTVTGIAAVFALTDPAMAAATKVNIVDPTITARVAHVDAGDRLAVQEVPPATFFHGNPGAIGSGVCVAVAVPPSGKALVVRQIRVNISSLPSPGNASVFFYTNSTCTGSEVGSVTPPSVGLSAQTFDPGLAIPSGGVLSAFVDGSLVALVYPDGYSVAASVAP
jgi:hypothetical protein